MFTDKAKKKLKEWLIKFFLDNGRPIQSRRALDYFNELPSQMQWGVIQDFADSLGYNLLVSYNPEDDCFMWLLTSGKDDDFKFDETLDKETRQEARTEAIKKLNELINS